LGYISVAESLGISSTAFTQCAQNLPNSVNFHKLTQNKGNYAVQGHFKITDFGTNQKLIYDFLLMINTNLPA